MLTQHNGDSGAPEVRTGAQLAGLEVGWGTDGPLCPLLLSLCSGFLSVAAGLSTPKITLSVLCQPLMRLVPGSPAQSRGAHRRTLVCGGWGLVDPDVS